MNEIKKMTSTIEEFELNFSEIKVGKAGKVGKKIHCCKEDYSVNKTIQDGDFEQVVIPLLNNKEVFEHLGEIQKCYH
jgi:hypothetical protein